MLFLGPLNITFFISCILCRKQDQLTCPFCISQRLLDINRMLRSSTALSSRRRISGLETDEESGPSPTKRLYEKKLQALKPEKNHRET